MAQTKRKRKRKHRGTAAGTVDRAARRSRPLSKEEQKRVASERRRERLNKPPTLRGAVNRAAIAAVVFGVLLVLIFSRRIEQGALLAAFMFLVYIPLGYATDLAIFRMRQRRAQATQGK
ncbi:MAG TPA: hypothetical protein VEQ61_01735 [Thermoleophilaceae bacterium]|nr:hypothetical protein [Thermoleophilaceae bacterium]